MYFQLSIFLEIVNIFIFSNVLYYYNAVSKL